MADKVAILDACVLYPAPLRDFFMHLAVADAFRARWTDEIHDEWIRNVLKNGEDLNIEKLNRTRQLMDANVRDCIVYGYEDLIDSIDLPDADDRHVLAAAITAEADAIVTFNLKDFPRKNLKAYGIEAVHPDNFIVSLHESRAELVELAAMRQHQSLKNPPVTSEQFLETLRANNIEKTVERLRTAFEEGRTK